MSVTTTAQRIRVLAMVPYPVGRAPGQRYRLEQWAPRLRDEGVDVVFTSFLTPDGLDVLHRWGHTGRKTGAVLGGYAKRFRELQGIDQYDLVYVYREAALLGSTWIESRVARHRPIVFDFDDAIYLGEMSAPNRRLKFLKSGRKVETLCRLAQCVTVGNSTLAGFAEHHAREVAVVPSTIDTDAYTVQPRPANARPVIGWTGSATTVSYLAQLATPLRCLHERHPFTLRVIGASVSMPGVDIECLPWRPDTEVGDLRPLDIGLMPLSDDEWARGKCGLKALQYMALGIPPVVSPIGVNAEIVRHEQNGLHARSADEWVTQLTRLLLDPGLRHRLGKAARSTVETGFAASVQAPRVAELFRKTASITARR